MSIAFQPVRLLPPDKIQALALKAVTDLSARAEVIDILWPLLYKTCIRNHWRVGEPKVHDPRDIAQEAWIVLWNKWVDYKPTYTPQAFMVRQITWLYQNKNLLHPELRDDAVRYELSRSKKHWDTSLQQAEYSDVLTAINELIAKLSDNYKDIISRALLQGESLTAIGKTQTSVIGKSRSIAAATIYHRAELAWQAFRKLLLSRFPKADPELIADSFSNVADRLRAL